MVAPLLETKLHVPNPRPELVVRPRLVERLRRGTTARLTLISAPPGSGKTTLLADWVAGSASEHASLGWLSLDTNDNESTTFWTYVIAALQTGAPGVGASTLNLLQEDQQPISEADLTSLINDLSGLPHHVTLVLDDYHVIHAPEVQAGMVFFLEHLPEQVNLVIATRSDPALPLARLRGRRELVEIRAADLRFTSSEADAYLHDMGVVLTSDELAVLDERTEGWIAALQLAALSMQSSEDVSGFIAGFAGSNRYIVDYLVEEVLQNQPDDVRSFLLQTSVLDRLSGPLCDAVTGKMGGKAMLERLDRANLFTVPLDDHRHWYRYHHLFADVLHARLLDEHPDRVRDLHRKASAWWERNGEQAEALRHALNGEDYDRAADLVELALPDLAGRRQEHTMREWLDSIPDDLYETRPVLAVGYVGSRLVSGDLQGVETRLRQAEQWVDGGHSDAGSPHRPDDMVVLDHEAFRRLPGSIAVYRTALALSRGDVDDTIDQARRALSVIGEEDHLERGSAAGFLALAHWSRGELHDSYHLWSEAAKSLEKAGHVADVIGIHIALADILIEQGQLREASRTYERGLEFASGHSESEIRGVADMHVGLAELFREWNDLAAAREHLEVSEELGAQAGLPQNAYRSKVVWARVREAEGHFDEAVEFLDEAERLYTSDYFPDVRPIPAMRTRVWIRQGNLVATHDWALEHGLSIQDEPSYLREFEHITLVKNLLASGTPEAYEVGPFLERLLTQAERGGRTGRVIEILTLQAIARIEDRPAALTSLERAMALAEPEGYVRVFADHDAKIAPLLEVLAENSAGYASELLAASKSTATQTPSQRGLVEPLTERELEVLRLLNTDLAGPEIARQLFVSLNTLRTHTKSIYTKLGATSRRTAIRRAGELGLLPLR